jgi:hypothetical protein
MFFLFYRSFMQLHFSMRGASDRGPRDLKGC